MSSDSVAETHVMPHYRALLRKAVPGQRSDGRDATAPPERSQWQVTPSGNVKVFAVESDDNR